MASGRLSDVLRHPHLLLGTPSSADTPDRELLERFTGRRAEEALVGLLQRYGPLVWGVCGRVLRNSHDAEDAFQATFLVPVRKAGSIANTPRWAAGSTRSPIALPSGLGPKPAGGNVTKNGFQPC